MKTMTTFQLLLLGIFIFIFVVAVLIFAGILPGFRSTPGGEGGEVVLWGTVDDALLAPLIESVNAQNSSAFNITYVEKNPASLEAEYVTALADGRSPDLILAPHDFIFNQGSRFLSWSYDSIPRRTYQDTFILGTELIYTRADGVLALPLAVDPIVLYYNRTALTNAGIVAPPATWTELLTMVPRLTTLDDRRNVIQSAVSLGTHGNIRHYKDLLALLMIQSGTPIIEANSQGLAPRLTGVPTGAVLSPAAAALDFYAQFSDPARVSYTWNRSLPEARLAFAEGRTTFYLGFASEYNSLKLQNPHLDFDVALSPRAKREERVFFGRFTAVGVAQGSRKVQTAFAAASVLASDQVAPRLASTIGWTPVLKSVLARGTADPIATIFYQAAIGARAWFDFDPLASEQIFKTMIESVTTGRAATAAAAASAANKEFELLIESRYDQNR